MSEYIHHGDNENPEPGASVNRPKVRYMRDDPRSPESIAERGGVPPTPEEVAQYLINDWEFEDYDLQSLTEKIASGEIPYGVAHEKPEPKQPRTDPRDWSNMSSSTSGFSEAEQPRTDPREFPDWEPEPEQPNRDPRDDTWR